MIASQLSPWLLVSFLGAQANARLVNVTFVNDLRDVDCSLFWHGNSNSGPRKDFGPLLGSGGEKTLEVSEGHVFTFASSGTMAPLLQITIDSTVRRYVLNDTAMNETALGASSTCAAPGSLNLPGPLSCNVKASCGECVRSAGCGWSTVHRRCVSAHPIATSGTCNEAHVRSAERSAEQWLHLAESLMDPEASGFGLASLRAAYEALEHGQQLAADATLSSIERWKAELRPKLEGVLGELDAAVLINTSRHASLSGLRPGMVARHRMADALAFIARAQPVVITDMFEGSPESEHPIPHKWTLEYLNRFMHGGFYNVAADVQSSCCQYYEPRRVAADAGYPYPFRPRTHLYRDHFKGFVSTMRGASGASSTGEPMLHYLHDVVMERDGAAVIAGEVAPTQIKADLSATVAALRPLMRMQPFFAGIANAKLWVGQKGVTMPLHYDSSDNLYVMAWGRKRAILAEPGQYGELYPYPNGHPLAGSSQVNLSNPDLLRYPGFANAVLWEVVVGPGDVLYLPAYWWHQFEQPFEDTASVNVWSYEVTDGPPASVRDARMRTSVLHDHMERAIQHAFKNKAGVVLASMASRKVVRKKSWARANQTLHEAVEEWRKWMLTLPNSAGTVKPSELIEDFLQRYLDVLPRERWPGWAPGSEWNLSFQTPLPPRLGERCEPAPKTATYTSVCRWT